MRRPLVGFASHHSESRHTSLGTRARVDTIDGSVAGGQVWGGRERAVSRKATKSVFRYDHNALRCTHTCVRRVNIVPLLSMTQTDRCSTCMVHVFAVQVLTFGWDMSRLRDDLSGFAEVNTLIDFVRGHLECHSALTRRKGCGPRTHSAHEQSWWILSRWRNFVVMLSNLESSEKNQKEKP